MRYQIVHQIEYNYDRTVFLEPHILRLRSRCDSTQSVQFFSLKIVPEPRGISQIVDLDGNSIVKIWFRDATDSLQITATTEVETYRDNPFNYILDRGATKIPIDYSISLLAKLQPYLGSSQIDPAIFTLAQEISHTVKGETSAFLTQLNQQLYENCQYQIRIDGDPLPPGITWKQKSGSCRDVAVLFMEACRAVGLAARFVSGYQEGDPDQEERHLHAWVEVYLPGGGWCGYDPTQGLAVADRHIAVVASPSPTDTTPVSGFLRDTSAKAQMQFKILLESLSELDSAN